MSYSSEQEIKGINFHVERRYASPRKPGGIRGPLYLAELEEHSRLLLLAPSMVSRLAAVCCLKRMFHVKSQLETVKRPV